MTNVLASQIREHASAIMQQWEARVRTEVLSSTGLSEVVLRDDLEKMLEVMTKVLADETDPGRPSVTPPS
jgi:hypothetical protein